MTNRKHTSKGVGRPHCDREALKMKVVEAARKAFVSLGIRHVRMDDLAASLSISKRTLYELFSDKEELLLQVMMEQHRKMNSYIAETTSRVQNVLEVVFSFYAWRSKELGEVNPLFFRELRKYPRVIDCIHEEQRANDTKALKYFHMGVEQGIFRSGINFEIIIKAMSMQLDMLIFSDLTEDYPLADIYREITLLHMRGITTLKGLEMVDEFLGRACNGM